MCALTGDNVMANTKKWFESNERSVAKRTAKQMGVDAWKYTKSTRAGKSAGFYVGSTIPKMLTKPSVTVEKITV